MQSCKWKAESWLLNSSNARTEFRRSGLEFSNLAKAVERALNLPTSESVTAEKLFETHVFKSGSLERIINAFLRTGRRDLILHPAADPDRHVQKIRRRMIILIGGAQSVGVDPSQKKSADFNFVLLSEHRSKDPASFCAAGKSGKPDRPLRRLRPIISNHLQAPRSTVTIATPANPRADESLRRLLKQPNPRPLLIPDTTARPLCSCDRDRLSM